MYKPQFEKSNNTLQSCIWDGGAKWSVTSMESGVLLLVLFLVLALVGVLGSLV